MCESKIEAEVANENEDLRRKSSNNNSLEDTQASVDVSQSENVSNLSSSSVSIQAGRKVSFGLADSPNFLDAAPLRTPQGQSTQLESTFHSVSESATPRKSTGRRESVNKTALETFENEPLMEPRLPDQIAVRQSSKRPADRHQSPDVPELKKIKHSRTGTSSGNPITIGDSVPIEDLPASSIQRAVNSLSHGHMLNDDAVHVILRILDDQRTQLVPLRTPHDISAYKPGVPLHHPNVRTLIIPFEQSSH
jgi:hypothetical protein